MNMKIIIKDEQVFKILGTLFNTMYGHVRYKKDESRLSVYKGDKLRRHIGTNADGSWKLPTYIVEYYPNDKSLWISDYVYTQMKNYFPPVSDNMLFFDFFKKWFIDKFGIIPEKVYIVNQGTLNDEYNN